MDEFESTVFSILSTRPGQAYITPDGTAIYVLAESTMLCIPGTDLHLMSDTEVNKHIQDSLT
jgi:hypothetical protein